MLRVTGNSLCNYSSIRDFSQTLNFPRFFERSRFSRTRDQLVSIWSMLLCAVETFDILHSPAISYLQLWLYLSRVHVDIVSYKDKRYLQIFYILFFYSLSFWWEKNILILHILYIFFIFILHFKIALGPARCKYLSCYIKSRRLILHFNYRKMCNIF